MIQRKKKQKLQPSMRDPVAAEASHSDGKWLGFFFNYYGLRLFEANIGIYTYKNCIETFQR